MKDTWASGAVELLQHADAHLHLSSAFDFRIAFISVDNSVETMMRTYVSMPSRKSGVKIPRKTVEDVENSFPRLLRLFMENAHSKLIGIDEDDIEHYHRIRNKLYHDGTGLSVSEEYLKAYRQIAGIVLENIFGITNLAPEPSPTLEHLVVLWNKLEKIFKQKLADSGIDVRNFLFWEAAIREGILSGRDAMELSELRSIRNKQVHSTAIDNSEIKKAVSIATKLLEKLG